jgi:hypothetical protein
LYGTSIFFALTILPPQVFDVIAIARGVKRLA